MVPYLIRMVNSYCLSYSFNQIGAKGKLMKKLQRLGYNWISDKVIVIGPMDRANKQLTTLNQSIKIIVEVVTTELIKIFTIYESAVRYTYLVFINIRFTGRSDN